MEKERQKLAAEADETFAPLPGWVMHDFRRTGVTTLAEMGIPPHMADKLLNHVQGTIRGVAAIYQRGQFMEERKRALQTRAAHVMACAENRTMVRERGAAAAEGGIIPPPHTPLPWGVRSRHTATSLILKAIRIFDPPQRHRLWQVEITPNPAENPACSGVAANVPSRLSVSRVLETVGEFDTNWIKATVRNAPARAKPNAKSTIAQKGSTGPLVDDGVLVGAQAQKWPASSII